jgi:hypothetical protein
MFEAKNKFRLLRDVAVRALLNFVSTLAQPYQVLHPKKISSSGVDNWYLDDFFKKFICGR